MKASSLPSRSTAIRMASLITGLTTGLITSLITALTAGLMPGCTRSGPQVAAYTSVDQVFSEPIFGAFSAGTGITVQPVFDTEETKSTGVLNRLLAEAGNPQADIFWSGDPVRPFLLMRRGLVEAYRSPSAASIPGAFKSADGLWTGFAARARVLLVNTQRVPRDRRPRSIRDLADPAWKGQTAIASPLYGTTTLHVAALATVWGEQAAQKFLQDLRANGARIAGSNGEVKRLVVSGEAAFGLTDTDDAYGARSEGAPVDIVYPDQEGIGTLVMPTTVVLIRNGPNPDAGRKLIDYLLSAEVERRLAESAAQMPLRPGVEAPEGVLRLEDIRAMEVDYNGVADEMERLEPWLRRWVGL